MICIHPLKTIAAVSVILPAVTIWIWGERLWTLLLFVLWVAGAAFVMMSLDRKEQAKKATAQIREVQELSIKTLNHHRHDWMNDLQVLYGYIRMNKPDKVSHFVERIRDRMTMESIHSKLGEPALVFYIQSLRALSSVFHADVRVEGDVNLSQLPVDAGKLSQTIIGLIELYRRHAETVKHDLVQLRVLLRRDEDGILLHVEYDGELTLSAEAASQWSRLIDEGPLRRVDDSFDLNNLRCKVEWSKEQASAMN